MGYSRAARVLDQVQNVAQLTRFDAAGFLAAARDEQPAPGATLEALADQLDGVRALLGEIDRFAEKDMRIRSTAFGLPRQLHMLLHGTILSYQHDLPLLRERIGGALARVDTAAGRDAIVQAAEEVLATRATLRQGVAELAQALATAWLPVVQRAARDRSQPDEPRVRWKRALVDLERVAARVDTLETGSFTERLERIATPDDLPDEERPDRFSLIELD